MLIFPAIDMYGGKAVRLYRGDYEQMTATTPSPSRATSFWRGRSRYTWLTSRARATGTCRTSAPCARSIRRPAHSSSSAAAYAALTRSRACSTRGFPAILGTAAVSDPAFLEAAVAKYGNKIAAGCDLRDGVVAVKGWLESSGVTADEFFSRMTALGIDTIICTDIARDGAMRGANAALYGEIMAAHPGIKLVASGGVSGMEDIGRLRALNLYGAIVGKAYYTGAIDLKKAVEAAK